jgi:hypothetical protein
MNAASVQLFGAALDASDFARVRDKPEVVLGQKVGIWDMMCDVG